MRADWNQLKNLLVRMAWRDISLRYRGSMLGVLWSFIVPLLTVGLYTFLFSYVFKASWHEQATGHSNYALILFAGLIVHGFLSDILIRASSVIRSQSNLVKKVVFPLHALPAVVVLSVAFQMLVSLCVLTLLQLFVVGQVTPSMLAIPFLLFPLLLMGLGFSWFFASLGVFLQDLSQIMGLVSTALMFTAPILFPLSALPDFIKPWLFLNPLTFIVEQLRIVLLFGGSIDWLGFLAYCVISVLVFLLGWWIFDRTKKGFADVL